MLEIIQWIKKEKLIKLSILPVLFCLIAILSSFYFSSMEIILDLISLTMLIMGSVLALRPGMRNFLNPGIKKRDKEITNRNASILAFIWIILGFSIIFGKIIYSLIETISTKTVFLGDTLIFSLTIIPLWLCMIIIIAIATLLICRRLNCLINKK